MGRARGANAKLAAAFETTYGTPPASGSFSSLPFASSALGVEIPLEESDLLGNGAESYDPTYGPVSNDGDVVVPIDTRYFGYWLKLMFGDPATSGGSGDPYEHVFTSGATDLPSMAIETQYTDRARYAMNYGLKGNTLQFTMQKSGLTSATVSLIGKGGEKPGAVSATGALATALAFNRFVQASGQITLGGARLASVVSGRLSFTNALDKVETVQPDGEIEDADAGVRMASGSLTMLFAEETLFDAAMAGDPVELGWGYTLGTHGLALASPRVFLPVPKATIEGPKGIQATFNWQASGQEAPCLSATLTNDVATY